MRGLTLRLFGGVAIRFGGRFEPKTRAPSTRTSTCSHPRGTSQSVSHSCSPTAAYAQDEQFNAVHGHYRLIYDDVAHSRQVDVFVGRFQMCHVLPLSDRLNVHSIRFTLPPTDLALTKLQIVELTDKDQRDLLSLLLDHEVGEHDGDEINDAYIARLCAAEWGLWRTVTRNLERLQERQSAPTRSPEPRENSSERRITTVDPGDRLAPQVHAMEDQGDRLREDCGGSGSPRRWTTNDRRDLLHRGRAQKHTLSEFAMGAWAFGVYAEHPRPFDAVLDRISSQGFDGVDFGAFTPHPDPGHLCFAPTDLTQVARSLFASKSFVMSAVAAEFGRSGFVSRRTIPSRTWCVRPQPRVLRRHRQHAG